MKIQFTKFKKTAIALAVLFVSSPSFGVESEGVGMRPKLSELSGLLGIPKVMAIDAIPSFSSLELVPEPLNLNQSLNIAIGYSLDVAIARTQEEGQISAKSAAWRDLGPKVDLRKSVGNGQYTSYTGVTTNLFRSSEAITLRQPLFNWAIFNEALRQSENAETSRLSKIATESATAYEAGSVYLSTLQSRLIIEYTQEYENHLQYLLNYMNNRVEAGGSTPADLERVKSRVENARSSISENRAGLISNLSQFVRLLGRYPQSLEVPATLGFDIPFNQNDAISVANANNLELRAARSLAIATAFEKKVSESKFLPRVDLEATHDREKNPPGVTGHTTDNTVAMIMSWNIFSSGADVAARNVALSKQRENELRVENSERKLRQQLENDYSILASIDSRFTAIRSEIDSNKKVVDAFNEQLFSTNRQLLDVLDAYQRLYQSKVDVTNLLITEAQVQLQVAHYLGQLKKDEQQN